MALSRLLRSRAAYPENPVLIAGYDGDDKFYFPSVDSEGRLLARNVIWNPDTLDWEAMQQPVIKTDTLNVSLSGAATEATLAEVKSLLSGFALQFAVNSGVTTTMYVGQASPGSAKSAASWQIQKIDTSSGVAITWADGNRNFDNIWDNREGLTYE